MSRERRATERAARPLQSFLRTEAGSASLLLAATLVALVWANSPAGDLYRDLWDTELAFTIGDMETAAGTLTVSGTSADTARIPNANIVFSGSGANRFVTVTPTNTGGTATITVNRTFGSTDSQLRERHSVRDFEVNREDMVQERGGDRI